MSGIVKRVFTGDIGHFVKHQINTQNLAIINEHLFFSELCHIWLPMKINLKNINRLWNLFTH